MHYLYRYERKNAKQGTFNTSNEEDVNGPYNRAVDGSIIGRAKFETNRRTAKMV